MIDDAETEETMEAEFLGANYAYNVLGFNKNFFDVRKANKRVVRYHLGYGAKIIDENDIDYFFEYTKEQFNKNKHYTIEMLGL